MLKIDILPNLSTCTLFRIQRNITQKLPAKKAVKFWPTAPSCCITRAANTLAKGAPRMSRSTLKAEGCYWIWPSKWKGPLLRRGAEVFRAFPKTRCSAMAPILALPFRGVRKE